MSRRTHKRTYRVLRGALDQGECWSFAGQIIRLVHPRCTAPLSLPIRSTQAIYQSVSTGQLWTGLVSVAASVICAIFFDGSTDRELVFPPDSHDMTRVGKLDAERSVHQFDSFYECRNVDGFTQGWEIEGSVCSSSPIRSTMVHAISSIGSSSGIRIRLVVFTDLGDS